MKLNKIMTYFCIGMPICVLLRIFQIVFTIEFETGFYIKEYQLIGKCISVAYISFCLLLGWFCFKYYKSPDAAPKTNIAMAVTSLGLAVGTVAQAFLDIGYGITLNWQIAVVKGVGIITALYFVAFAFSAFIPKKLPPIIHIVPCVFMIIRTALVFINTSALAHITDNVLLIASYCVVMIFFLNFAKLYNNVDTDKNFRKLLASGLTSATLCFTQSISHFIINIASGNRYLHVSHIANASTFLMGGFIIVFILSHFCLNKD